MSSDSLGEAHSPSSTERVALSSMVSCTEKMPCTFGTEMLNKRLLSTLLLCSGL